MRANMRVPWGTKQQQKEQERRRNADAVARGVSEEIRAQSEARLRQMLEERFSSFATAGFFSTLSTYIGTASFSPAIESIPVDRRRVEVARESKQRTLEPVLVDPPPLRPVRAFE